MAIASDRGARDVRALARRIHEHWLEYRRRNPGMSVPINDTLSRLLEHVPEYQPLMRSADRQRRELRNPGVFTVKAIADALHTTVGALLGEQGFMSPRELLSPVERRKLREAIALLNELFDLDDPQLDVLPFGIAAADFIAQHFTFPEVIASDSRRAVIRVIGDSMEPLLPEGSLVAIDTAGTRPEEGALVAIYTEESGSVLGRWSERDGVITIQRVNPRYAPIPLTPGTWRVLGVVET